MASNGELEPKCWVLYRIAKLSSGGHVGRFLERRGPWLRLATARGTSRVHVDDIEGYWVKGAKKRDHAHLKRLTPARPGRQASLMVTGASS